MMKLCLEKDDLVNLVKGINPNYSIINHTLVEKCGTMWGGHSQEWEWDKYKLENLSEHDLLRLYYLCKDSWK